MKRILPLLALAAVSTFAGPKFGIDAAGLVTMPSYTGEGTSPDTKLGFGGKVAGAAEFGINEKLAVRASAGYQLTTWGLEQSLFGETISMDCNTQQIVVGADAVIGVAPQFQILAGFGAEIPVSGTYEISVAGESESGDIEDTQTSMFIEAGAGYVVNPAMSVNAKYKFALTEYSKDVVKLNQIQVGVSYNFGN